MAHSGFTFPQRVYPQTEETDKDSYNGLPYPILIATVKKRRECLVCCKVCLT